MAYIFVRWKCEIIFLFIEDEEELVIQEASGMRLLILLLCECDNNFAFITKLDEVRLGMSGTSHLKYSEHKSKKAKEDTLNYEGYQKLES